MNHLPQDGVEDTTFRLSIWNVIGVWAVAAFCCIMALASIGSLLALDASSTQREQTVHTVVLVIFGLLTVALAAIAWNMRKHALILRDNTLIKRSGVFRVVDTVLLDLDSIDRAHAVSMNGPGLLRRTSSSVVTGNPWAHPSRRTSTSTILGFAPYSSGICG